MCIFTLYKHQEDVSWALSVRKTCFQCRIYLKLGVFTVLSDTSTLQYASLFKDMSNHPEVSLLNPFSLQSGFTARHQQFGNNSSISQVKTLCIIFNQLLLKKGTRIPSAVFTFQTDSRKPATSGPKRFLTANVKQRWLTVIKLSSASRIPTPW